MNKRFATTSALAFVMLLFVAGTAVAQEYRPQGNVYLKPRVGFDYYAGDRDGNPGTEIDRLIELRGLNLGLELGYAITRKLDIGILGTYGHYSPLDTETHPSFPSFDLSTASENRLTVHLGPTFNFSPDGKLNPYVKAGIGLAGGKIDDNVGSQYGISPMLGFGLDYAINERFGAFFEANGLTVHPDEKWDGVAPTDSDDSNYDVVGITSLGLRVNLKKKFVPVAILSAMGPRTLDPGQGGTFEATTNADATQPTTYTWDFGDGTTAEGLVATHSYDRPGTYTVTFTAANKKSTDVRTMTVEVIRPIVAPSISSISANATTVEAGTPIDFTANVGGDSSTCTWDFGDGTTATGTNPSHTYSEPGTYTVKVTCSNEGGTDTKTMNVTIVPVEVDFCSTVVDLNTAFFNRNSSTLSDDAKLSLMDNVAILSECANMSVRVEGLAAPGERRGTALAEARAKAVEAFYIENGIAASRIMASGLGVVEGVSRKEGTSQFRRADSMPMQ